MVRLARGKYGRAEHLDIDDAHEAFRRRTVLMAGEFPHAWISHATAARLRNWWLPERWDHEARLHLSAEHGQGRGARRPEITWHRVRKSPTTWAEFRGVRVSGRERTWVELASLLSVEELIVLGDQLVRTPYRQYDDRADAWTSRTLLESEVDRSPGVTGIRKAREALDLIRSGSDSPAETQLRLAILRAGLPEPDLQVPAAPEDPRSPKADMGYPELKVAIQYDGGTHFDPDQARRDQDRDNWFLARGWTLLRFNRDHRPRDFAAAVSQLRLALAGAAAAL